MARFKDIRGEVIGRLTVVRRAERDTKRRVYWECLCSCGQSCEVVADNLNGRRTQSCGCLHKDLVSSLRTIHGQAKVETPEYRSYKKAKERCNNTHNKDWEDYGGRGIKFLFTSFIQFFETLGEKPSPKHLYSIDRVNNDGNYEIGNVRWSTRAEQAHNRRLRREARCREI